MLRVTFRAPSTTIPPESNAWTDVTCSTICLGAFRWGLIVDPASGMAANAVVMPSAAASWMSLIGQYGPGPWPGKSL